MSSDRMIVSCLKTLNEVERYILEGKRDPVKVQEVLQDILQNIHLSSGLRSVRMLLSENSVSTQRIVAQIKKETELGLLEWEYALDFAMSLPGPRYHPMDTAIAMPEPDISYRIEVGIESIDRSVARFGGKAKWASLLLRNGDKGLRVELEDLAREDQKFFFEVLKRAAHEKEESKNS